MLFTAGSLITQLHVSDRWSLHVSRIAWEHIEDTSYPRYNLTHSWTYKEIYVYFRGWKHAHIHQLVPRRTKPVKPVLPGLYCSDRALLIAIPTPSITARMTPPAITYQTLNRSWRSVNAHQYKQRTKKSTGQGANPTDARKKGHCNTLWCTRWLLSLYLIYPIFHAQWYRLVDTPTDRCNVIHCIL